MILWTSKGGIGMWKLTEVEERIFVGDYRDLYAQVWQWKWKSTYHFAALPVRTGNIWIYFMSHLFSIIVNKFYVQFLSPLNDASLIFLIMRVLFSFLLKLNSHHPDTFTSPLLQTLKQNHHRASHNCYSVNNMLKLLLFKWL